VLTQGATGLDFTEATVTKTLQPQNNQPCAIGNTYAAGQTCTVSVVFAPQAPGSRPGSILLTDSSHNVLSTTYLPGTGFGPEIVFNTGVKSTLPSYSGGNYSSPLGVTVDAALNVYVADTLNSRIIKIPWTGSAYGTPINITAAGILSNPGGIAVDGNGNLFIADTSDNQIVEVPWNGSTYGARVILDNSGLPAAYGIAVDATGNLFFSDSINEKVFEMAWTGTAYASPVTLTQATGLHAPHGLATDSSLNLYIADSDDSQIVELPHQTSGFGAEIVLPATNLFYPEAVAVDAAGDVYIANSDAASVVELPYNGSSYGAQITVPFGILGTANGLAVDGNGNIYVADATNNNVVKLTVSGPPTLTFASTNVGSTSSDSPKTVPLFNIGNGDLTLNAAVSYPTSFPENTKDTKLCANGTPIIPGSGCDAGRSVATWSSPTTISTVPTSHSPSPSAGTASLPHPSPHSQLLSHSPIPPQGLPQRQ
jgi:sugar lactone lactonase YvrE